MHSMCIPCMHASAAPGAVSFNIATRHAPQNNVRTVPGTLCCRCRSCMWHLRGTFLLSNPCNQNPADISELTLPRGGTIAFVDGKDKLLHFQITMRPDEGIYRRVLHDIT